MSAKEMKQTEKASGSGKTGFVTRLAQGGSLPTESLPGVPFTEICIGENSEITVSSCRGILMYSSEIIRLRLDKHKMTVTGEKMVLRSFSDGSVKISGEILGIQFERI